MVPSDEPDDAPREQRAMTIPEVVTLLHEGEMTVHQLLPWSSNYTFLAHITRGEIETLVVYKPRRGERPLWDFPTGTLYQREAAAFIVSDTLGWHVVPPTVVREGDHGIGMVQLFIEHDPEEHFFTFRDEWREELTRIALFDALINNADRKGGHCLRDTEGRIWAIDHGVSFHEEPKLRTVIWELAGKPIPKPLLEDLRCLQDALRDGKAPSDELAALLAASELAALQQRLATLTKKGKFPLPPPGQRHVPWPLV